MQPKSSGGPAIKPVLHYQLVSVPADAFALPVCTPSAR